MKEIIGLKLENNDFEVEFEILPPVGESPAIDSRKHAIDDGLRTVNAQLSSNQQKIDALNKEIDRLTNHADGIDYMVAVGSGILAGLIDSFWVGAFNLESGKKLSNRQVNEFVMNVAKQRGYKGDRLHGAIGHLEDKYKIPSDNIWKGNSQGI